MRVDATDLFLNDGLPFRHPVFVHYLDRLADRAAKQIGGK
jgi:hypothetical protein